MIAVAWRPNPICGLPGYLPSLAQRTRSRYSSCVDAFWKSWLLVPLGGALGATLRHGANVLTVRVVGLEWSHLGTLFVNGLGCLVMGGLMQVAEERASLPENVRWFLVTGLLGSLTTFSAFGHETMEFVRDGKAGTAIMNVGLNLAVGLSAVAVGWWVAKQF